MKQQEKTDHEKKRKKILDFYRLKQPFRCSIGKSKWLQYVEFNPDYNLREILKDEVIVEFDSLNHNEVRAAVKHTTTALKQAGVKFSVWSHGGRSPHIHIHDLDIPESIKSDKDRLRFFKKVFIKTYTGKFYDIADKSLAGIHLVRIEWSPCWKKKYGIKKLVGGTE